MSQQLIGIQRRFMRLGKVRLGDKGTKGEPRRLTKFRLTSPSRALLEAAAAEYGGEVKEWTGAPDEGVYELYTNTDTLDIILPPVFSDRDGSPTLPYSQAYEMWSAGGCERRCDGETEVLSGKPCLCGEARGSDPKTTCRITTRLNVMLPKIPGLGVWMMESHGWNAASLLPGTLDLLMLAASQQRFIPAVLRLEPRTSKRGGQTRKFVVPVIDLPELRMHEVLSGGLAAAASPAMLNAPAAAPPRPELPAGEAPPDAEPFENDILPSFGEAPEIVDSLDGPSAVESSRHSTPAVGPAVLRDTDGPSSECIELHDELVLLCDELGATDSIPKVHEKADAGDVAWMKRQIATMKRAVKARDEVAAETEAGRHDTDGRENPSDSTSEAGSPASVSLAGQGSFFQQRATEAQAAQQRRRSRSRA